MKTCWTSPVSLFETFMLFRLLKVAGLSSHQLRDASQAVPILSQIVNQYGSLVDDGARTMFATFFTTVRPLGVSAC